MLEIFKSMTASYLEKTKGFVALWMLFCAAALLLAGVIDVDIYAKSLEMGLLLVFTIIIAGLTAFLFPGLLGLHDLLFKRSSTFILPALVDALAYVALALVSVGCYFLRKLRH